MLFRSSAALSTEGQSVTFVYVDAVQGWVNTMDSTSNVRGETFVTATVSGACNTLTTAPDCANVKVATFVNPGTFCVSSIATCTAQNTLGYMVVAGGGAGGGGGGGGGGAGGFREGRNVPVDNFTASPLVADAPTNAITVTATAYPITVGGGGAGAPDSSVGGSGDPSTFSSVTSTGGGGGSAYNGPANQGAPGGSGGGGGYVWPGTPNAVPDAYKGVGNTPSTAPPQGNTGGKGTICYTPPAPSMYINTGGGGGASAVGADGAPGPGGGPGGAGVSSSVTGASVTRSGGGGGGTLIGGSGGSGGSGGGGAGGSLPAGAGTAGTVNTGGGGGGASDAPGVAGVNGGSGIVVIRYKFQ